MASDAWGGPPRRDRPLPLRAGDLARFLHKHGDGPAAFPLLQTNVPLT